MTTIDIDALMKIDKYNRHSLTVKTENSDIQIVINASDLDAFATVKSQEHVELYYELIAFGFLTTVKIKYLKYYTEEDGYPSENDVVVSDFDVPSVELGSFDCTSLSGDITILDQLEILKTVLEVNEILVKKHLPRK